MQPAIDEQQALPQKLEDRLRWRAFRVFYHKTFRNEESLAVRFAKAIVASAGPIHDHGALRQWCRKHRRRHREVRKSPEAAGDHRG